MQKVESKLVTCGICLNRHLGVLCSVCGVVQIGSEYVNRISGLQMVRGLPMPIRVRIERAAKRAGVQ